MFRALIDLFCGKTIESEFIPIHLGKLKIMLKERKGRRYVYMRFGYLGNVQYHQLGIGEVDQVIQTLVAFRDRP